MSSCISKFPLMRSLVNLAIVHTFFVLASAILEKPQGLYLGTLRRMIDRVTVRDSAGIAPGYTATINWSQTLPGVVSSALSLYNFEVMNSFPILSYTAELRFVNVSNGLLQVSPMGPNSTVNYLAFSILIVTDPSNIWEILTLEEYINSMTMVTSSNFHKISYVYSSKYTFSTTNITSMTCIRFMQWFTLSSSAIASEYIDFIFSLIVQSSAIKVTIRSNYGDKWHKAKFGLLIYPSIHLNNIAGSWYYIQIGDAFPANVLAIDMAVPTNIFGSPYYSNLCLFGFVSIGMYMNRGPTQFQYTLNGTSIINVSYTTSILSVGFTTYCYASCPSGKYLQSNSLCLNCTIENCQKCTSTLCKKCNNNYLLSNILNYCVPCAHYISNCLSCSSDSICTQCSPEYILAFNNASCLPCSNFMNDCYQCTNSTYCTSCIVGFPVMGSCTTISGCIQTVQAAPPFLSFCASCDASEYNPNPVNGVCICKGQAASIITNHCTAVSGCIASKKVGDIVYCMACNVNQHFIYDGSTHSCFCAQGYTLQQGTCLDTCGDGVLSDLECDDGNTDSGDGCSSVCLVEINHRCSSNNSMPSSCQYVGKQVKISLIDTKKTKGLNQGIFTFAFDPAMPLLNKYNFSQYFQFSCNDATHQVSSWTYLEDKLTLIVDYQTDLEGRHALVNFTFNQLFIRLQPTILQFTVKSNNIMLIIGDESQKSIIIRYIFLSSSVAAAILLVLGSWAHSMAGVQLVISLQLIYYLHFTTLYYTPALSCFQELSLVGLNDLFLQVTEQNYNSYRQFQKVHFSLTKAELTIAGIAFFLTCISIIMFILFIFGNLPSKDDPFCKKATSLASQVYRSLLLPTCLWFLLPEMLAIVTVSTKSNSQSVIYSKTVRVLCSFASYAICTLSFAFRLRDLFISQKDWNDTGYCKGGVEVKNYLPFFQLYLFLQAFFVIFWMRDGNIFIFYTILFIQLLMAGLCIYFRPYTKMLDRVTLVINLALVCVFLAFLTFRQKGIIGASQINDIFCVMIIAVMTCLCTLLAILRVFTSIYKRIRQSCSEIEDKKIPAQEQRQIKGKVDQKDKQKPRRKRETLDSHLIKYLREGQTNNIAFNTDQPKDEILKRLTDKIKNQFRKTRKNKNVLIRFLY